MSQVNDIDVDITYDNATERYKATVSYAKAHVKRLEFVRWTFKRKDKFPDSAAVIVQFVDQQTQPKAPVEGPFVDGKSVLGSYSTTGKYLSSIINTFASGSYCYTISYDDGGGVKELLDPEIIVDGNSILFEKFLKGMSLALKGLQQRDRLQALIRSKAKKGPKAKKVRKAKKAKSAKKTGKRPAAKKR